MVGLNKTGIYTFESGFIKWEDIADFKLVKREGYWQRRYLFIVKKDRKKEISVVCQFYVKESLEDILKEIVSYREGMGL